MSAFDDRAANRPGRPTEAGYSWISLNKGGAVIRAVGHRAIVAMAMLLCVADLATAQQLVVQGDFTAALTNGTTYHGTFRGTLANANTSGSATFHSDEFDSFDAELVPPQIGGTRFDRSNLELLLQFQQGKFEQLWFGGDYLGPNGSGGDVDDFFVQWSNETDTLPDSGYFSDVDSSFNVTMTGGNLQVYVPEPSSSTLCLLACLGLRRRGIAA